MTEPMPASTVIVVRDGVAGVEVYLLRRSARSAFMPDVFVFPGGRVEARDRSAAAAQRVAGATEPLEPAYVYAAARETFEEAGLLFAATPVDPVALRAARQLMLDGKRTFDDILVEFDTAVDAGAVRYFSRWITPEAELARRFDARFFVARAPLGQIAQADSLETHDGLWITPQEALARRAAGTFALIFPTIKHLERLSGFATVDAVLAFARTKPIVPVMPIVESEQVFVLPPALENVW